MIYCLQWLSNVFKFLSMHKYVCPHFLHNTQLEEANCTGISLLQVVVITGHEHAYVKILIDCVPQGILYLLL